MPAPTGPSGPGDANQATAVLQRTREGAGLGYRANARCRSIAFSVPRTWA